MDTLCHYGSGDFLFFVLFWKKSCSLLYADVWPAKNVPCVVFACIFEDTLWGPRPGWGGYIVWPWQLWFIDDKSRQVLLIVLTIYACWWKVAKTNIWPQCFHAKNCTCRFLKYFDLSDIIFFVCPLWQFYHHATFEITVLSICNFTVSFHTL